MCHMARPWGVPGTSHKGQHLSPGPARGRGGDVGKYWRWVWEIPGQAGAGLWPWGRQASLPPSPGAGSIPRAAHAIPGSIPAGSSSPPRSGSWSRRVSQSLPRGCRSPGALPPLLGTLRLPGVPLNPPAPGGCPHCAPGVKPWASWHCPRSGRGVRGMSLARGKGQWGCFLLILAEKVGSLRWLLWGLSPLLWPCCGPSLPVLCFSCGASTPVCPQWL